MLWATKTTLPWFWFSLSHREDLSLLPPGAGEEPWSSCPTWCWAVFHSQERDLSVCWAVQTSCVWDGNHRVRNSNKGVDCPTSPMQPPRINPFLWMSLGNITTLPVSQKHHHQTVRDTQSHKVSKYPHLVSPSTAEYIPPFSISFIPFQSSWFLVRRKLSPKERPKITTAPQKGILQALGMQTAQPARC